MYNIYYRVVRDAEAYTLTLSRRPLNGTVNPVVKRASSVEMMNAMIEIRDRPDSKRFKCLNQRENDVLGDLNPTVMYDSDFYSSKNQP
jgi:hypothetical protein